MERNARLYKTAKHLIEISRILLFEDSDLRDQILDIAELVTQRISIDEREIGEIKKYEQELKK